MAKSVKRFKGSYVFTKNKGVRRCGRCGKALTARNKSGICSSCWHVICNERKSSINTKVKRNSI